jgi:hypothetical protein
VLVFRQLLQQCRGYFNFIVGSAIGIGKAPWGRSGGFPICLPVRLGDEHQVLGGTLAVAAADEFILNPPTFAQASQPGPLEGRDVHERIGFAALRLDEAIAFGRVKPLHNSDLQLSCLMVERDAPGNTPQCEIASAFFLEIGRRRG